MAIALVEQVLPAVGETFVCSACKVEKDVSERVNVQTKNLINDTREQVRCRTCHNLRSRLQRLSNSSSIAGYTELSEDLAVVASEYIYL